METQEAVSEHVAASDNHNDSRKDGQKRIVLGPNDSLEGKLIYDGHIQVEGGGRAEGEFRVSGNIDIGNGTTVKALLEGSNVTVNGDVEGRLTARDKLTLGKSARLSGDVQVKRLQIADGATLNGYVRMGDVEQQAHG